MPVIYTQLVYSLHADGASEAELQGPAAGLALYNQCTSPVAWLGIVANLIVLITCLLQKA